MANWICRNGILGLCTTALAIGCLAAENPSTTHIHNLSTPSLEQRLQEIEKQLDKLASYSINGGIGSVGYRTIETTSADQQEWIQIDFGKTVPLDEVILVPAIRRDAKKGFQADGFPERFRLIAGTDADPQGRVVAEYTCNEHFLPRIAPLIIPCHGIMASWIRIHADQLSRRGFDGNYAFQLSEILAFSGEENIALMQTEITASNPEYHIFGWDLRYAVDGVLPYLMDAASGKQSPAYISLAGVDKTQFLAIDLGKPCPVSRIHLHAIDQSDTQPQAFAGDLGIPKRLYIEGANQPDFSEATLLVDLHHESIYDIGPIIMRNFVETTCRYIRLKVMEPSSPSLYGEIVPYFGFAEIEVFSKGSNIALHKPVSANFNLTNPIRIASTLTDGCNIYGAILPIRNWLHQLAQRHELETEKPLVTAELNRRYERQKRTLAVSQWALAALAAGTTIIILAERSIRQRAIFKTRERIAANLHDELGANLHAIGLLGDLAKDNINAHATLIEIVDHIRALTERTGAAARYCINMLETGLCQNLTEEMKRSSERLLIDAEHEITIQGEEFLQKLNPYKRIDLFLFYKECLTNILRHSNATHVTTHLEADHKELHLSVTDNGHGFDNPGGNIAPPSLNRRARLMGAQICVTHPQSGGTCIRLKLKLRNFSKRKAP